MQPPFFDLNADEAVNYGAIGAVIGHEIGHWFDDSGSTFDGDRVLRNWWTDEDLREQINTDPHSPRQYRVNGVVRNVPEFYEVFDIAETDALYLAPEDRVKIW